MSELSKLKDLSVFFPCYNEEKNIVTTVKKAVDVLEKLNLNYEIIIVDDGSTDQTGQIAEGLAKNNSKIRVIHHQKNLGYGEALKSGFYNSRLDTIAYNDGDGQFDFSEVTKFIDKVEEADLIIGYRIKRADHPLRALFAKGWAFSLWSFFGLKLRDVDCGFKLIKKEVLEKIGPLTSTRGGMINAELAIKAKKLGFKIAQVGVKHFPRLSGKPTGASLPVIAKSYLDLFKLWWQFLPKLEFFALIFILGLAAFFRFYKLPEYMTFLGDEGRDALIVKKILVEHDLPFIGPQTSIGNIYLGPLYYYMMAIPMAIFWLKPEAAAAQVALIGVATVGLIYFLGRTWFGKLAGLLAAFLYAISPVTIIYSRSSWNPNPASFFALLGVLGLYLAHKLKDFRWLILTGGTTAFALQMHYLALILLPIFGLIWLYELGLKLTRKATFRHFLAGTLGGILVFLILMSPLLWFDLRHDLLNFKAISTFFLQRETTVNLNPFNTLERIVPIYTHSLISRYITAENPYLTPIVSVLVFLPLLIALSKVLQGQKIKWPYMVLGYWLMVGILGMALYKQQVFTHYLGFLNPAPFLLLGALAVWKRKWVMGGIGVLVILLTLVNLQKSPLQSPPNRQLQRTQEIVKFIIGEAKQRPFNFALIAKNNYDSAYQFYLEIYGHKPKQLPFEITKQLFVVCEDPICQPVGHPKYEIAAFGWAKTEKVQELQGVRIYKLIHNPSGRP